MIIDKTNSAINNIENIKTIIRDPEYFLKHNYYRHGHPNGFRIDLFVARKYNLIYNNLRQFNLKHPEVPDSWLEKGKSISMVLANTVRVVVTGHSLTKYPKKTFCPYCEKDVIPKRLHKLDPGDIVLVLFTAGLWVIFLLVMYTFIRRCPVCNYNLRGFKPLQKTKM